MRAELGVDLPARARIGSQRRTWVQDTKQDMEIFLTKDEKKPRCETSRRGGCGMRELARRSETKAGSWELGAGSWELGAGRKGLRAWVYSDAIGRAGQYIHSENFLRAIREHV